MHHHRNRLVVGLVMTAALVAACDDGVTDEGDENPMPGVVLRVHPETNMSSPVGPGPQYGFEVIAEVTNERDEIIYLARCNIRDSVPLYAVPNVAGDRSAYEPIASCPGSGEGLAIQPGETRMDMLRLHGPNVREGGTEEPVGSLEGRLRLLYFVSRESTITGSLEALNIAESSEFTVELER